MALTPRQRLFVGAYLICPNAAQAARDAGYSERTAKQQGARLLTNVDVAAELGKLRARQERRSERKLEHVLNELDNLAFTRMPNFAGLLAAADPVEHLRTMDPEDAAAIESVTIDERTDENGEKHRRIKLKLYDKRAALTDLGRHLGMGTGRVQVEQAPPMARPDLSMLDAEDRDALRKICEKMERRQSAPQIEGKATDVDDADD